MAETVDKPLINVDVVSDIMCPWCWVGKRKLEESMQQSKDKYNFRVRWQPFLLRPEMPEEGIQKAPETPGNSRVGSRLKAAGQAVGIDFTGKCDVYPRTVLAHTLMEYAGEEKDGIKQDDLQEVLFRHYFTDGLAPTTENLLKAAAEVGLDVDAAKAFISDRKHQKMAFDRAIFWSSQGVSGVPTFYINGRQTFSGAQDTAAFSKMFEWAVKNHPNGTLTIPAHM